MNENKQFVTKQVQTSQITKHLHKLIQSNSIQAQKHNKPTDLSDRTCRTSCLDCFSSLVEQLFNTFVLNSNGLKRKTWKSLGL